jgi:16S rRNA (adenine1518-N6/adenine1519-N6)-dimethyltransferase
MFLKKALGQHLLTSQSALERIVRALNPSRDDTVVEIGPGTGNLTSRLLSKCNHVIAIEKDKEMVDRLGDKFGGAFGLEIINADFLKYDLTERLASGPSRQIFCGNLPYNISTPILFKLKDMRRYFSRGVVMLQREVALRLTANPGGKDYGVLSIMMQVSSKMKRLFDIPPGAFIPPPKVTSSVVEIVFPEKEPYHIKNQELFARVVRGAFSKRRKMIRNCLPKEWLVALEKAGIEPTRRPEEVSIDEFALITLHLCRLLKC